MLSRWYASHPILLILGMVGLVIWSVFSLLNDPVAFLAVAVVIVLFAYGLVGVLYILAFATGQSRTSTIPLGEINRVIYLGKGRIMPPAFAIDYLNDGESTTRPFTLPWGTEALEEDFETVKSAFRTHDIPLEKRY
jgi:hypothetical protein